MIKQENNLCASKAVTRVFVLRVESTFANQKKKRHCPRNTCNKFHTELHITAKA